MTLVVRDEADILDAQLAFHLNAGVDLVLAVDHGSTDGTSEILEHYVREGHARVVREEGRQQQQGEWVTHLARRAAVEERADWVLLSDADEFWWPRGGSLREVLAVVPAECALVYAPSRTFLPRPDDGRFFAERMTVRLAGSAPINDPATPFRPVSKVAARAHPNLTVLHGNHTVEGVPPNRRESWHPIEILHFPLRSSEQTAAKYEKTLAAWSFNPRGDLARARRTSSGSGRASLHERVVVDDEALVSGLAAGLLAMDVRLRDALRSLAGASELPARGAGFSVTPDGAPRPVSPLPTTTEDVFYAIELAVLREADTVRAHRAVDGIEERLRALEMRTGRDERRQAP